MSNIYVDETRRKACQTLSDTSHPLHSEFECFLQAGVIEPRPTKNLFRRCLSIPVELQIDFEVLTHSAYMCY